jgi:hypothetical protein
MERVFARLNHGDCCYWRESNIRLAKEAEPEARLRGREPRTGGGKVKKGEADPVKDLANSILQTKDLREGVRAQGAGHSARSSFKKNGGDPANKGLSKFDPANKGLRRASSGLIERRNFENFVQKTAKSRK